MAIPFAVEKAAEPCGRIISLMVGGAFRVVLVYCQMFAVVNWLVGQCKGHPYTGRMEPRVPLVINFSRRGWGRARYWFLRIFLESFERIRIHAQLRGGKATRGGGVRWGPRMEELWDIYEWSIGLAALRMVCLQMTKHT